MALTGKLDALHTNQGVKVKFLSAQAGHYLSVAPRFGCFEVDKADLHNMKFQHANRLDYIDRRFVQ